MRVGTSFYINDQSMINFDFNYAVVNGTELTIYDGLKNLGSPQQIKILFCGKNTVVDVRELQNFPKAPNVINAPFPISLG